MSRILLTAFAKTTQSSGNSIFTPGLDQIVPVGSPFTVTWSTGGFSNDIALVLLRGPSTNILPLYAIADGIANTGSFSWTPSADLEPDVTHYGLQIIDNASGSFQWSTQFGISNPSYGGSSSSAPPPSTTSSKPSGKPSSPPSKSDDMPPPPPPSGKPSGPPPSGGSYPESNCTSTYTHTSTITAPYVKTTSTSYAVPPVPTGYTGPLSNNAGRYAVSAAAAMIAAGAVAFLL
jgi:hypothetical protein